MAIKFGYRCIVCGETFDNDADVEQHITDNSSHIIVEQYYDSEGVPTGMAIQNDSTDEIKSIGISDDGNIVAEDTTSGEIQNLNSTDFVYVHRYNKNTTYRDVALYSYLGKNTIGIPKHIYIIGDAYSTSYPYSVRVYDITNKKVIAEINNLNNTTPEIFDAGVLSNLPDEKAVFSIQIKTTKYNKRAYLECFMIQY